MALAVAGVVSAIGFLLALSARRAIPHDPVMLCLAVLLQAAWIVPYARAFHRNWRRTVRSTAGVAGIECLVEAHRNRFACQIGVYSAISGVTIRWKPTKPGVVI